MRLPQRFGANVHAERATGRVQRPRHWQSKRAAWYYLQCRHFLIRVQWRPWYGAYPTELVVPVDWRDKKESEYPSLWSKKLKKISLGLDEKAPLPALSGQSKILGKFTYLCAFLSDTAYDDGSPRAPGRFWLDSDGTAYRVTLFEPSAMVKMTLRATTLDDVLFLANQQLGAESPPWEVDQYARDKAAEKNSKKNSRRAG